MAIRSKILDEMMESMVLDRTHPYHRNANDDIIVISDDEEDGDVVDATTRTRTTVRCFGETDDGLFGSVGKYVSTLKRELRRERRTAASDVALRGKERRLKRLDARFGARASSSVRFASDPVTDVFLPKSRTDDNYAIVRNASGNLSLFGIDRRNRTFDDIFANLAIKATSFALIAQTIREATHPLLLLSFDDDDDDDKKEKNAASPMNGSLALAKSMLEELTANDALLSQFAKALKSFLDGFDETYVKGIRAGVFEDDGYWEDARLDREFGPLRVVEDDDDEDAIRESISLTSEYPYEETILSMCDKVLKMKGIAVELLKEFEPRIILAADEDSSMADDEDEDMATFLNVSSLATDVNAQHLISFFLLFKRAAATVLREYPTHWRYVSAIFVAYAKRSNVDDAPAYFGSIEETVENVPELNEWKKADDTIRNYFQNAFDTMQDIVKMD